MTDQIETVRPRIYSPTGKDLLAPEPEPTQEPAPAWAYDVSRVKGQKIAFGGHWFRLDGWGAQGIYLTYVEPTRATLKAIKGGKK